MDSFNEIKDRWQNQPEAQIPDVAAIEKAVNKNRRQMIAKNVISLVTLGGTLVFIGYIGIVVDFKFLTTRLGIVLIMISIMAALVVNSQLLMLILKGKDTALDNQEYLQQLIRYQNKQRFFQTKGMLVYYALMTIGFVFYLYEFYARNAMFGLAAYALTLSWIAFAWFYIHPKAVQKQEKKINDMIEQIKSVSAQLDK